jgi:LDH2 family malate/lactate/ureidoglycolate dehydrogenase
MRKRDAGIAAEVLVTTDTWGTYTHGTNHLRNYVNKIKAGGIDPRAVPEVIAEGPSWAVIDGHSALGMVTSCRAMELAIRKARAAVISYVGVRNSAHFGAAGYYANLAVQHDMIGLAMSNTDTNMTAPGARGAVIGNNPLALAVPAGKEQPIFLDIALSAVASAKVWAAKTLGRSIPGDWIVDSEGTPTTDLSQYPQASALLPMAGHKGYGLALLVETLGAVLTGAAVTTEVKSWLLNLPARSRLGHAFVAINIGTIMPVEHFKARMDTMIRKIRESPKAKGSKRIYLPGEMEWERRAEALERGMLLPEDVIANLTAVAQDLGMNLTSLFA